MRSLRSYLTVAGSILLLSTLATSVSAGPALKPLKIAKECSKYSGDIPSFCTITRKWTLGAIPAGTKVFYYRTSHR